ncbi:MAG: fibronectin type III domain-containing protein [candidate division Zixibacteria bacterium]|nr:fibronectin type III domain-containing protein [candidate division Zixibacteria bacterium]
MNSARSRMLAVLILAGLCAFGSVGQGLSAPSGYIGLADNRQPRQAGVHDAGDLYLPVFGPQISISHCLINSYCNPETGEDLRSLIYPNGSGKHYMAVGAIWVGGVIDGDTIVSQAFDDWSGVNEFCPEDRRCGGMYRTGNFADDEFVATVVDTTPPAPSRTLGLRLTSVSYTWADTLYDDFAVITYTIHNIKDRPISDGWVGVFLHNDIYQDSPLENYFDDEYSGVLDTLLYDDDPAGRVLIPYGIDNDGDPLNATYWGPCSVRGAVSIRLLDADFDIQHQNFNWWSRGSDDASDFGPRRLGTPDDPLRLFGEGWLGTPTTDEEQYYVMAHPEVDYDQTDVLIHDFADGWVQAPGTSGLDCADGSVAHFMLSFGPFDLAPGDSVSFTIAVVLADNIHGEPSDFAVQFDPYYPEAFRQRLDFGPLLAQHRRADSVYKSGLTLPSPGPPQGLIVSDYQDALVRLSWWPSRRPDLAGYFLCTKNPAGQWVHASPNMITDTVGILYVPDPKRTYELAVSAIDTLGRESKVSMPVSILTGRPHPVENLELLLDGVIPELSWVPHDDTTLQGFIIHRSIWDGPFQVYDSTTNWQYCDLRAESGVRYTYRVVVKNRLGLESFAAGPVSVLPMAMNKGVLFCNLNRVSDHNTGPFRTEYLDRLYQSVAGVYPMTRFNRANKDLSFKQMADYSLIIIDWERFEDGLTPVLVDSLKYYLKGGPDRAYRVVGVPNLHHDQADRE